MNQESISLYYRDGGSDKVYHTQIAAADGGFVVNFQYGRRGSALQTGTKTAQPVSLDKAKKIYDKLVTEKQAKGYTTGEAGTPYQGTEQAGRVSGLLPQLLNAIDEEQMFVLLADNRWMAQEKKDGVRLMVRKSGDQITANNRKGLVVPLSQAIEARLQRIDVDQFVLDGEAIGDVYWVFDALEMDGNDLREETFDYRYDCLVNLCENDDLTEGAVRMVFAAYTPDEKRQLLEQVREAKGEGVVFKRIDSLYRPGRPASGGNQLKFKFTETCTCLVDGVNEGKRSVRLTMQGPMGFKSVGNVTIPSNFDVPEDGDLVEVRYLYAYPGGSLYQPVYLGVRTDLSLADKVDTLKCKQGTDEDES